MRSLVGPFLILASCPATWAAIEGRVFAREAGTRVPLSRVAITVRSATGGERLASTTSGADGYYRLPEVPRQRIILSASRAGFYTLSLAGRSGPQVLFDCSKGCDAMEIDFELARGAVLSGVVTDELGEPVEQARISLAEVAGLERVSARSVAATDDRGFFRMSGLEPGNYAVTAQRTAGGTAYQADLQQVRLEPGRESRLTLRLRRVPRFRVSGQVLEAGEARGGDLRIVLEGSQAGQQASAPAAKGGHFEFDGVAAGKYRAYAIGAERAARQFLEVIDVRGEMTGLILRPAPTAAVEGRVRLTAGKAASPFYLLLSSNEGLGARRVVAGAPDFAFHLEDLAPGSYKVQVDSPGVYIKGVVQGAKASPPADIALAAGRTNRLEILLAADYGQVHGTVRQHETSLPWPHARVALAGSAGIRSEQADQAGRFQFTRVVPGEYRICAWADIRPELIAEKGSWEKAGCGQKIMSVAANSDVELELTAAP